MGVFAMKKHGNLLSWVMVCLLCLSLLPAGLAESKADQPPLYYDGYDIAVVQNPDPLDRLHLRAKAYGSAKSLGKYYNGAVVALLPDNQASAEWVHVRIGDTIGYMEAKFLAFGAYADAVEDARPRVMVNNQAGTGLNLRRGQNIDDAVIRLLKNGTEVTVLGVTEDWLHVLFGHKTGYIRITGTTPRLAYSRGVPGGGIVGQARVIADPLPLYVKPLDTLSPGENADALTNGYAAYGRIVTVYRVQGDWALLEPDANPRWAERRFLEMIENE